MKIQHETIEYYIDDALDEIDKIRAGCKKRTLDDAELLVWMEHALHMFNTAFNLRHMTRKKASELSQEDREKHTLPPKEIFGGWSSTSKISR